MKGELNNAVSTPPLLLTEEAVRVVHQHSPSVQGVTLQGTMRLIDIVELVQCGLMDSPSTLSVIIQYDHYFS